MNKSIVAVCIAALAGGLLAVTVSPAEARNCIVPNIRTLNNQTVSGTMYAVSGKRCSIVVTRSAGPVFSSRLVSPPRNGSVSVQGMRVVYTSRPGFVGEDRFVYARQGMDALNQSITRTVEVNVKVSDRL
jgi:hypothetical protein